MLDLHDLSAPVARTAVRLALDDMVRRPDERRFHDTEKGGDFFLITGRGKRSEGGEAILKPAIMAMLHDEFAGLVECREHVKNPGRLVVPAASLHEWIRESAGELTTK